MNFASSYSVLNIKLVSSFCSQKKIYKPTRVKRKKNYKNKTFAVLFEKSSKLTFTSSLYSYSYNLFIKK